MTTTAIATAERKKALHRYLEKMGPEIGKVVSQHMTPEQMTALVYTEAARNPQIYECLEQNPASVASTIMLAAELGLPVSGPLGFFYLIPRNLKKDPRDKRKSAPRWMTLTYIIGYKGLLELSRRSDDIVRPNSGVVYAAELPENGGSFHWVDEPPECRHPRLWSLKRKDEDVVGAYALVELRGGHRVQLLIDRDEIDRRRARAMSDTFWKDNFPAMARKTAIRALLNGGEVPLTPALQKAIENDLENERLHVIDAEQIPAHPDGPRKDPLRERLELDSKEPEEEPAVEEEPEPAEVDLDSLPLLDQVAHLEGQLDEELRSEAASAAKLNLEAELEGQGKKVEKYRDELRKRVDATTKRRSK